MLRSIQQRIVLILLLLGWGSNSNLFAFSGGKSLEYNPPGYLHFYLDDNSRCSGTKISSKVILTAAHCSEGLSQGESISFLNFGFSLDLKIEKLNNQWEDLEKQIAIQENALKKGQITKTEASKKVEVLKKKINLIVKNIEAAYEESAETTNEVRLSYSHPKFNLKKYSKTLKYDVGLIVLEDEIQGVKTAKIDFEHSQSFSGKYMLVGHDKNDGLFYSYKYQIREKFKNFKQTQYYKFPDIKGMGTTTQGDSGAPLYRYNSKTNEFDIVVGVVSGSGPKLFGSSSNYASISNLDSAKNGSWIQKKLADLEIQLN